MAILATTPTDGQEGREALQVLKDRIARQAEEVE